MFGERLKLARKRSGLSLRDLALTIDGMVSAQSIGKYERGEMMPGSGVATALSEALTVPISYLYGPSTVSLESVAFRKLSSARVRDRAAVEAEVLDHTERYLNIEEILGLADAAYDAPEAAPYPVNSMADAESAAERVRTAWNLGGGPIANMTEFLENRGMKVFNLDLPKAVDGVSCFARQSEGYDVPVIVCSPGKSAERQRFTLAHELGHMVLDISPAVDEEKACQRFAGAFLVPRQELMRELGRHRHKFGFAEIIETKRKFRVSAAALVLRMNQLGIIRKAGMQNIFSGIGRKWRKEEPCPLNHAEEPTRFRRLCLRALAENEISISKAAELLRMRTSEIDRVMVGAGA